MAQSGNGPNGPIVFTGNGKKKSGGMPKGNSKSWLLSIATHMQLFALICI
jgi:hypothetical protein